MKEITNSMNQKIENQLNLALETPEAQRERTDNLNVGFDTQTGTWELIVRYHGSLDGLRELGIVVEELLSGYAILTAPENLVETVADFPGIEYVEKPKRYYYGKENAGGRDLKAQRPNAGKEIPELSAAQIAATEEDCLLQVTRRPPFLTGAGVLVAVLDSGIDYKNPVFRRSDGSTRIRYLWDQTLRPGEGRRPPEGSGLPEDNRAPEVNRPPEESRPPEGFALGVEYSSAEIDRALLAEEGAPFSGQSGSIPSVDSSGHGTAVAGIAAGYSPIYEGVATGAELLIVKLGTPNERGFPRTAEIMRGITWALRKAEMLEMPLVINLSFGNSYGAHDGSSILERFLDSASQIGRTVICVGSGNEASGGGHVADTVANTPSAELAVAEYERNLNLQIWKNYGDIYRITLRAPDGQEAEINTAIEQGKYTLILGNTQILVFVGEPSPYAVAQEIYLEFLPLVGDYIDSGIWSVNFVSVREVTGQYFLYLPPAVSRSARTGFFQPTPQVTLTIPSTASGVITVGAYDAMYNAYADFSGRGYGEFVRTVGVTAAGLVKPDLAAPGVNILAPDVYGGFAMVTGTSFATPIAAGSAALLMEWGIVRGNDRFLYGEKMKACLRAGAQPLRGEQEYPNERVGYGALCISKSLALLGGSFG